MKIAKDQSGFVETEIDDEVVLMDLASGHFFSLEGTSLAVWRLIDGNRSEDGIVAALAAQYDEPVERVAVDVAAFLAELRAAGLLAS